MFSLFDLFQLIIIVLIPFLLIYRSLCADAETRQVVSNRERKRAEGDNNPYRHNGTNIQMDIRYRCYLWLHCGVCESSRNVNRDTATGVCPFLTKKTGRGFVRKNLLPNLPCKRLGILCNSGAITPIIVKKIPPPDGHPDGT